MGFSKHYAIIVAGGKGLRMQQDLPKQFLLLQGLPILMHTLYAFQKSKHQPQILLVLPEGQLDYWQQLCEKHHFKVPHQIITGGKERFFSVKNALDHIQAKNFIVAIHDGVRPLILAEQIDLLYEEASKQGAAIPYIQATESVRLRISEKEVKPFNREAVYLMQTPQVFDGEKLKKAYDCDYRQAFTDDASVWETLDEPLSYVPGWSRNIKITKAEDLKLAAYFMQEER